MECRQRIFIISVALIVIGILIFAIGLFLRNALGRAEAAQTHQIPPETRELATAQRGLSPAVVAAHPSPDTVKTYVISQAKEHGVNPIKADWIISHESQYGQRLIGDSGKSIGPWQFNLEANKDISRDCALDLKCSTHLAFQWIADGKINAWSVWKMRHQWFESAPD
jgi:hypothetical protein